MNAFMGSFLADPRFSLLAVFSLAFAAYFAGLALAKNRGVERRVRSRIQWRPSIRRRR